MVNNRIDGFQYGIYASSVKNFQISRNEIRDCDVVGIYISGKVITRIISPVTR